MNFILRVTLLLSLLSGAAAAKSKLAVMPLAAAGVEKRITTALSDILTAELAARGQWDVLSSDEVQAMLGLDALKQALGCDEMSCAAEIGGALGADFMVTGNAARLGSFLSLKLSLFDTKKMRVVKRVRESIPFKEDLLESAMRQALAKMMGDKTAKPTPQATSLLTGQPVASAQPPTAVTASMPTWQKVSMGSAFGVAGLAGATGAVLAVMANKEKGNIEQLAADATTSTPYPYINYQDDLNAFEGRRLGAYLAGGAAGVAAIAGLVLLFMEGDAAVAPVVSSNMTGLSAYVTF